MKLTPIDKAPRRRQLAAFDVQGDADAGMIGASLVTEDDERVYTEPDSLIADMTTRKMRGIYVYSHRLTYDAGVLIPQLPAETTLLFLGEKLFKGRMVQSGRHKVYLADSSGVWGGLPLSTLADECGLPRLPPPEAILRRVPGGGTTPTGEGATEVRVQDFSRGESRVILQAMGLLQDEILALGAELKSTLAATAMDLFRRRYLDEEYWTPFYYRNEFARKAYYGGRCEPLALGWWDCVNVYDFHSHYPAQMLGNHFPNPNTTIGPRQPGRLSWVMDFEGCSDCTVDIPHCKYPPLPYRVGWQTYFPVGVFRGTWCHNELRYAMQHGVRIKKVHATLYSEDSVQPFNDYVTDLWSKRQEAKAQGSPRALVYKLLLNSLSGKFGQRADGALRQLETMDAYWAHQPVRGTEVLYLRGTAYAKVPLAIKRLPEYLIAIWSAYITAYGRIALHKLMLECPGPVLYCDTDAVMCFADLPTGDGLGDLALQAKGAIVDVIAPKMYRLTTEDGETFPVAKGVPTEVAGEYCTYKEVEYYKALGWLEAARMKLNPSAWQEMRKKMMLGQPKRRYKRIPGWRKDNWISEPLEVHFLPKPR